MPMIKNLDAIKNKWLTVTPAAQAQYEDGIKNPKADWHDKTVAAEGTWKKRMADAKVQARHANRVANTTTQYWKNRTILNAARWGQGVTNAGDKYSTGYKPYHDLWDAAKLPAKTDKRDIINITARMTENVKQFIAIKDAQA